MEPIDYLRSLRRRWRVVLCCLLVAIAAAWVTAPSTPAAADKAGAYRATATLVQSTDTGRSLDYISLLVTNGQVPRDAARRIGYDGDPIELARQVTSTPDASTGSLAITASGTDGPRTAEIANAFAESVIAYVVTQQQDRIDTQIANVNRQLKASRRSIEDVQTRLLSSPDDAVLVAQKDAESARYGSLYGQLQTLYGQQTADPGLAVLQEATPVRVSSGGLSAPSSRLGRVGLGAVVGLLLGFLVALVLERFDTRLRTRVAAQDAYRLPILAEVPRLTGRVRHGHSIVTRRLPGSAAAEAYRSLRSSLLLLPSQPIALSTAEAEHQRETAASAPKVVLIVSAGQGEGKTSTVVNLAAAMAETGKRVLVLDDDLRGPEAHLYLDVPNGPGLSELLDSPEDTGLLNLSRPTAIPRVRLVTGGRESDRPTTLPTRMAQIIAEARDLADIVLVDTTPMLTANDAIDLMPMVDSVVVVARVGRTTHEQAARTVELLTRMRVPVSGVALIGTGGPGSARHAGNGPTYRSGGSRGSRGSRSDGHTLDSHHHSDLGAG